MILETAIFRRIGDVETDFLSVLAKRSLMQSAHGQYNTVLSNPDSQSSGLGQNSRANDLKKGFPGFAQCPKYDAHTKLTFVQHYRSDVKRFDRNLVL